MNCPVDGTVLVMSERQGVEIDYCPQCRGVWLDRGELDKIIDRADDDDDRDDRDRDRRRDGPRADPSFQPSFESHYDPRYDPRHDPRGAGYAKPKKKKKGLLGEIFDFD